ncbi:FtsW/RodA/SpoVE family cell cycle protein [Roseibium alexandrii]|jgi:cell division protein FtsW|uniref:Probable peptidoglycan glycosyltransferase FtsW n=2 Tax=Roseibium alexandrii TaxID=388408 RepID=A0A0M7A7G1_9HYPH|nr:putative peptidoglycan glycosyltransferase FtsW [Roseibium alexandrii]RMX61912.1 Bacterial cell division membrane protein [Roseibium alexandrii DFL-11]CTQ70799.1 Cell division protein FtsW [Roseibium alexandrii]
MVSRADRSRFAEWLWTVDHYLLAAFSILLVSGVVFAFAASPPVAERIGVDTFYFVKRQAMFTIPALGIMLAASLMTPRMVRRAALVLFTISVVLLIATLFMGFETKGARRWIYIAGVSVQASEYLKPAFVVLIAFLLSESGRRREVPGVLFAFILFAVCATLLVAQPDFGQTMLIGMVWAALFFLNGISWMIIVALGIIGIAGLFAAYAFLPHVTSRVDRFLDPSTGDTFQVDTALEAFMSGGWFGRGPGEGTVKRILPDSHADFIFAVVGEEFGVIACLMLVIVFAFIVIRGLQHASRDQDAFGRLATAGLVVLFGLQATINLSVNLHLVPSKGMTLPFISYGGSSLLASAMSAGAILALTRKRPRPMSNDTVTVSRLSPSSLM